MDFNNTTRATNGNHKKKELILEARHTKVIEDANNMRLKLPPRLFMPREVNKSSDNLPKTSKTTPATFTFRKYRNESKYLAEIPQSSCTTVPAKPYEVNTNLSLKIKLKRGQRKCECDNDISNHYANQWSTTKSVDEAQKKAEYNNMPEIPNSQDLIEDKLSGESVEKTFNNFEEARDQDIEERLKEMGLEITNYSEIPENLETSNSPANSTNSRNSIEAAKEIGGNNKNKTSIDSLEMVLEIIDNDEISENSEPLDSSTPPPNSRNSIETAKEIGGNQKMSNETSNHSMEISEDSEMGLEIIDNDEIAINSETLDSPFHPPNSQNSVEGINKRSVQTSNEAMEIDKELEMGLKVVDNDEVTENSETSESSTHPNNSQISEESALEIEGLNKQPNKNSKIAMEINQARDQQTIPTARNSLKSPNNETSNIVKSLDQNYFEIVDNENDKNYKKLTRASVEAFWNIVQITLTNLNELDSSSGHEMDTSSIYNNVAGTVKSIDDFSNFLLQNRLQMEETMKMLESIQSNYFQSLHSQKTLSPSQTTTNNVNSEDISQKLHTQSNVPQIPDQTLTNETSPLLNAANLHWESPITMEMEFHENQQAFEMNINGILMETNEIPQQLALVTALSQSPMPANTTTSFPAEQRSHMNQGNYNRYNNNNNEISTITSGYRMGLDNNVCWTQVFSDTPAGNENPLAIRSNTLDRNRGPLNYTVQNRAIEQIPSETINLTNIRNPIPASEQHPQTSAYGSTSNRIEQIHRQSKTSRKSQRTKLNSQSRHNPATKSYTNLIIQKSKFTCEIPTKRNENYPTHPQATHMNMPCPLPFQLNNPANNIFDIENPLRIHTYSTNLKDVQPRYIELDLNASAQLNFNYAQQPRIPAAIEQMPSMDYLRTPDCGTYGSCRPFTTTNYENSRCPQATDQPMFFGSNPMHPVQSTLVNDGMSSKSSSDWPSYPGPYFNTTGFPLTPPADVNYGPTPPDSVTQHSYNLE